VLLLPPNILDLSKKQDLGTFFFFLFQLLVVVVANLNCFDGWGVSSGRELEKGRAFVLRADEYEMEDSESEDDDHLDKALVVAGSAKRFTCDELYLRCSFLEPYIYSDVLNREKT